MEPTRADAVRRILRERNLDGFIQPRNDEFFGEFVPPSDERLAWLTGFTGSAGLAILLRDRAAVFSDGRYMIQLAQQTDPLIWERVRIGDMRPEEWLRVNAPLGARIGYDPWLMSAETIDKFSKAGIAPVAITNPIDMLWENRPKPYPAPARPYGLEFAGESAEHKRARVGAAIGSEGADAVLLTDPHAVAWLFNLRGSDLPYTPILLATALLRNDGSAELYVDPLKLNDAVRAHLGHDVTIVPRESMIRSLSTLQGQRVRIDSATSPIRYLQILGEAGAIVVSAHDPCVLPRAIKNSVERKGARNAHRRDAVAMCKFLAWFIAEAPTGALDEVSAAAKLHEFRSVAPEFRSDSFPSISAAGEHGAIVHYHANNITNRPIRRNEIYLIDSGGQYPDGTTDITRTLWTGPGVPPSDVRDCYTRVLGGHIALARARFPEGTSGPMLDALARTMLWEAGLDYDHGTGHGVGSYLSVHEGPVAFHRTGKPVPLASGMILSDEPGCYRENQYGIRLENLLLVREAALSAATSFLEFETLTLVPFDMRLVDVSLLDARSRMWLDAYHARVVGEIGPLLDDSTRNLLTGLSCDDWKSIASS